MGLSFSKFKNNIDNYINYLIIFLAFIIPISYSLRDISLILIIILWIVQGDYSEKFKKFKIHADKAILFYFSVFIIITLSNFWSASLINGSYKTKFYLNSWDYVFRYDWFYLFVIIIILTSFNIKNTKKAISAFILGMFVSELVSYGIILGFWTTRTGTPSNPTPFLANHSTYSLFLVITVFWILDYAYKETAIWKKILYYTFSFTATMNLFFNAGRTGQVIYFVLMFIYVFYHYKKSFKAFVATALAGILIFIALYNISPLFQKRMNIAKNSIEYIFEGHYNTSWGGRVMAWYVAKDIFLQKPVLGCGVGNVKKIMFEDADKYGKINADFFKKDLPHLHNDFLQILAETGLVGEILFLLFLIYLFKNRYKQEVRYFFYIFAVAYVIAMMTETFLMKNTSFLLFNIFISIFILNKETNENIGICSKQ